MPAKPAAEVPIDETLVRGLLAQAGDTVPDAAALPLRRVSAGWDSDIWRLGDDLAVRLPRRALAAPLVRHEQRALPLVGPPIEAAGVRVPRAVFQGVPGSGYPWHWSIVPWFDGTAGLRVPRADRSGWAEPLARALTALHVPAPADHPENPFRGVPLRSRDAAVRERLAALGDTGVWDAATLSTLAELWRTGVEAPEWGRRPVWIHGDLHAGNLVADGDRLVAIIDFGDVTAGDPAYDLSVAWTALDGRGRTILRDALADRYDPATWTRARAWAVATAVLLVVHSDDEPEDSALGAEAVNEVSTD